MFGTALFGLLTAASPAGPYFALPDERARFPLEETKADVSIAGVIARVRVTQVYRNDGGAPIEALYVFPGSTRSAVFGMRMKIGARTIEAKIEERAQAQRLYERAKNDGKTASLLEQERPNVFSMKVANILPGDRVEVVLDYTELLVPEDGTYRFVYPTVVGPRYESAEKQEDWNANPYLAKDAKPLHRWSLSARVAAGMPIAAVRSPSHTISPRFDGPDRAIVETDDERGGDRDFVLEYKLQGDKIATGMLLFPPANDGRDGYFLLMVQPPERPAANAIPPREYVFVLDVSGSMSGFPLETAKKTLRAMIRKLGPQDRFNVVLFAGGSNVLAEKSLPATDDNVARAMQIIEHEQGGGGTELVPALKRALSLPRAEGMATVIALITDGFVGTEKESFSVVRDNLGKASLFTFGIGTSVNHFLIEGLARAGMAEPVVVSNAGEAEAAAQRFATMIESPVLTDVEVAFEGFPAKDVEPAKRPDLFASRPIVVFGKYSGPAAGEARVTGANAAGRFQAAVPIAAARASDDLGALRYLWARHRIARLSDDAALAPGSPLESQVKRLGLEHGLLTQLTSFVAVDTDPRAPGGKPRRVRQPLPLPAGVSEQAIGGAIAGRGMLGVIGTVGQGSGGGGLGVGGNYAMSLGHGSGVGGLGLRGSGAPPASVGDSDLSDLASESAVVAGALDRDVIARVVRRARPKITHCYERMLTQDPSLTAKLTLVLTIDEHGAVKQAKVEGETSSEELRACILAVLRTLRFPAPAGGGEIDVRFPLVLQPGK